MKYIKTLAEGGIYLFEEGSPLEKSIQRSKYDISVSEKTLELYFSFPCTAKDDEFKAEFDGFRISVSAGAYAHFTKQICDLPDKPEEEFHALNLGIGPIAYVSPFIVRQLKAHDWQQYEPFVIAKRVALAGKFAGARQSPNVDPKLGNPLAHH